LKQLSQVLVHLSLVEWKKALGLSASPSFCKIDVHYLYNSRKHEQIKTTKLIQ